jgi:signal peptidase II
MKRKPVLLNVLSGILLVLLVMMVWYNRVVSYELSLSLSVILGGGIGNYIERVFSGRVTDFIVLKPFRRLVLNAADLFIFFGFFFTVILLMLDGIQGEIMKQ